jgi:ribosome-binding ATPase YchF (GTP1/OBG family)
MAISKVQGEYRNSASADTVTTSFASTPTAGNLLIAWTKCGDVAAGVPAISGWTRAIDVQYSTSSGQGSIFYKVAGAGESSDVVLVSTGSTLTLLSIEEWTGLTNAVLDKTASTANSGAVTTKSSGTTDTTTAAEELAILEKILICLNDGISARKVDLSKEEEELIKNLGLLSRKPIIYAANVSEDDLATGNDWVESVRQIAQQEQAKVVIVSAQVESELVELSEEERKDFLGSLGVEEGGLKSLIKATYELLGLRTYLTTGPQETRAWTIISGMKAPQAAGVIHSDFERGFIRAETVSYQDLVNSGTMSAAKEKGLVRSEGKEYIVQEGDVLLFRFNV